MKNKICRILLIIFIFLILIACGILYFFKREGFEKPQEFSSTNNHILPLFSSQIAAHRAGEAPESTMMAFKKCVEENSEYLKFVEFDIWLTSDEIPVICHDSNIVLCSDADEYFGSQTVEIGTKTYSELLNLNMGAKFIQKDGNQPYKNLKGNQIPDELKILTLNQILTYLESNSDFEYIIEIKDEGKTGEKSTDILYKTLKEFGCLQKVEAGTFHDSVGSYMTKNYPDLKRSATTNEAVQFYFSSLLNKKAPENGWGFSCIVMPYQFPYEGFEILNVDTAKFINYAHKQNIGVHFWTVNDVELAISMQQKGADVIITDIPLELSNYIK